MGVVYIENCCEDSFIDRINNCSSPVSEDTCSPRNGDCCGPLAARLAAAEAAIASNTARIAILEAELAGETPAIREFFLENQGEIVTVTATFGTVTGEVRLVGVEAVEIIEANGNVVILPYTSVVTTG
ncbi:MAG: hypothetical protein ACQEV7_11625 [Bacillota bacterium]